MSLRSAREKSGLSQGKVAKALGISDVSVSLWDTGKTKPRASLLPKIAKLYGVTIDELLSDTDNDTT